MKKTLIALVALSGLAMAEADYTTTWLNTWNCSGVSLEGLTNPNSVEIEGNLSDSPITLTVATMDKSNLVGGSTNRSVVTTGDYASVEQLAANTASGTTVWGTTNLGTVPSNLYATTGGLTITLSGLDSTKKYNLSFVSGYNDGTTGSWNTITGLTYDSMLSISGNASTMVPKNTLGSFAYEGVIANEDGVITFNINRPSYHVACINGIALAVQTPNTPEPATATLSLLALAGLAARRRRH